MPLASRMTAYLASRMFSLLPPDISNLSNSTISSNCFCNNSKSNNNNKPPSSSGDEDGRRNNDSFNCNSNKDPC